MVSATDEELAGNEVELICISMDIHVYKQVIRINFTDIHVIWIFIQTHKNVIVLLYNTHTCTFQTIICTTTSTMNYV